MHLDCNHLSAVEADLPRPDHLEAVIASFDCTLNKHTLQVAFDAIRADAHFCATNSGRYCPVPGGDQPDAAAMIAAIEASTNTEVEAVVGQPSQHMVQAVPSLLDLPPEACVMVGDRVETVGLLGLNAGMVGALTPAGTPDWGTVQRWPLEPTYTLRSLADMFPLHE